MTTYRSSDDHVCNNNQTRHILLRGGKVLRRDAKMENVFVEGTSVTRKPTWRRHCGIDDGKEKIRHDGTICKEEVQCHMY
jgi:hypothetical protein